MPENILDTLDPHILGRELKAARIRSRMTQGQAARIIGVARTTICHRVTQRSTSAWEVGGISARRTEGEGITGTSRTGTTAAAGRQVSPALLAREAPHLPLLSIPDLVCHWVEQDPPSADAVKDVLTRIRVRTVCATTATPACTVVAGAIVTYAGSISTISRSPVSRSR